MPNMKAQRRAQPAVSATRKSRCMKHSSTGTDSCVLQAPDASRNAKRLPRSYNLLARQRGVVQALSARKPERDDGWANQYY